MSAFISCREGEKFPGAPSSLGVVRGILERGGVEGRDVRSHIRDLDLGRPSSFRLFAEPSLLLPLFRYESK